MPELPEVETVVRGLSRHIVGQKVKHIHVPTKTSFKGTAKKAESLLIKKITRRGKGIIIDLAKDQTILVHLKMTGQLIYIPSAKKGRLNFGHPTDDFTNTMPSRHTRVWFELSKGNLYFNDQRRFGWVKLVATKDAPKDKFFAGLGMEPFDKKFTSTFLYSAIQRRPKSNIKAIILDQSLVTGIGNIYSDEALFYARLKPTRLGKSITKLDATRLVGAIKKVLTKGIKYLGTSVNTHRTPEGSMGQMQNYLAAYDRKELPCRQRCGSNIKKIRLNGRGTHYCPVCQK